MVAGDVKERLQGAVGQEWVGGRGVLLQADVPRLLKTGRLCSWKELETGALLPRLQI